MSAEPGEPGSPTPCVLAGLARAGVAVRDAPADARVPDPARPQAGPVIAGERGGEASADRAGSLASARRGRRVPRPTAGDPVVFGRGGPPGRDATVARAGATPRDPAENPARAGPQAPAIGRAVAARGRRPAPPFASRGADVLQEGQALQEAQAWTPAG